MGDAALREPKTIFELEPEQRAAEKAERTAKASAVPSHADR